MSLRLRVDLRVIFNAKTQRGRDARYHKEADWLGDSAMINFMENIPRMLDSVSHDASVLSNRGTLDFIITDYPADTFALLP